MQIVSAAAMSFTHGRNDAQKSMGIITMVLGTSVGGWRIIKTMGHKIIRLEPVHGFAAETSSAIVLFVTSHFGMPEHHPCHLRQHLRGRRQQAAVRRPLGYRPGYGHA